MHLDGMCHSPFTQQGLEKLNDKTTKDFFRSTNQQGLDALKQIMMKRNQIEHLEDVGCQREKRTFRCHNCKPNATPVKQNHVVPQHIW